MYEVIRIKCNVASLEVVSLLLPTLLTKLREEEVHLSPGGLVTVRPVTNITSVSQTKPPSHRVRVTVSSSEHLGRSHQLSPPDDAVLTRQYERLAGAAAHEGDQPIVEKLPFMFRVELFGPGRCEVSYLAPDHQELVVQDHVLDEAVVGRMLQQVRLENGEGQLKTARSDSAQ